MEKFKITSLGSGLKAVPLKVTSNACISEADITLFCNLFGIIIFLSHVLFFAPVFQKPCITEEWLCPICVQILCSFRLGHDKASPRAKGAAGFTTPSGCRALWAPPLLQLRTSAWWEMGQYSLPQKRDCKTSCGFVGSGREVPGNCFLVEMAALNLE